MSKCETKTIGSGKGAIVVNQKDYDDGFPLNANIKAKVEALESKSKAKSKAKDEK